LPSLATTCVERRSIGRKTAGRTIVWKRDERRRVVSDHVQLYTADFPVEVTNGMCQLE
jgi:hypothetical protein